MLFSEGYGLLTVLKEVTQVYRSAGKTVAGTLCTCLTQQWEPVTVQESKVITGKSCLNPIK